MIIRHAEKPERASPTPAGIDENGAPDPHSLTVRGWQRAGALVAFFAVPQQTVAPLRARIGSTYWNDIVVGDEDVLVEKLKAAAGVILVA